jgi:peptidyl-tRNA hydrolase, PTH1 family
VGSLKLVLGLGNPGPEYESTRHNVGWWALDQIAKDLTPGWGLGAFRLDGAAAVTRGKRAGLEVVLLKPTTYMNRSGVALRPFLGKAEFDPTTDLLVLVDDVSLDPGRLRLRAQGSAGGHNGLRSIEATVGSPAYPRLRIGVGRPRPGGDLVSWVLSRMKREDEERVLDLLPTVSDAVQVWIEEGIESAISRISR